MKMFNFFNSCKKNYVDVVDTYESLDRILTACEDGKHVYDFAVEDAVDSITKSHNSRTQMLKVFIVAFVLLITLYPIYILIAFESSIVMAIILSVLFIIGLYMVVSVLYFEIRLHGKFIKLLIKHNLA